MKLQGIFAIRMKGMYVLFAMWEFNGVRGKMDRAGFTTGQLPLVICK